MPNSERTSIEQGVAALLSDICDREAPTDMEQDLFATGYLDSMTAIRYVIALEDRFGVSIPTEELTPENFGSIAATSRAIAELQAS